MRKPHSSYEMFIKEQKPKYGKTFIEWFSENSKLGDYDLLKELQKKNVFYNKTDFLGYESFYEEPMCYFSDLFTKKLQLCQNIIFDITNNPLRFELNIIADRMDLYEDVIQEICIRDNVHVCGLPSGALKNGINFHTEVFKFENLNELILELSSGIVIMYYFRILEDSSIQCRYYKREYLTRNVLTERVNL